MNLQAICYLGRLRFPEQLEAILPMLPDAERTEAVSFLDSIKALSRAELVEEWSKLREAESEAQRRVAIERTRGQWDELAPSVRKWLMAMMAESHGREDSQG